MLSNNQVQNDVKAEVVFLEKANFSRSTFSYRLNKQSSCGRALSMMERGVPASLMFSKKGGLASKQSHSSIIPPDRRPYLSPVLDVPRLLH